MTDPSHKPRVHGIGGLFFKSRDPQALGAWYARHLDLPVEEWGGAALAWRRADTGGEAMTIWSPFKADTTYFAPSEASFMLNLRVDDLDATLAALREEGCEVLDRREDSEYGRFGYVLDPERNLVELWQPPASSTATASTQTDAS